MSYNPFQAEPKELMSDSLRETFIAEENQLAELENTFILASLIFEDGTSLMGNILGIEFGDNPKLDVKILTQNCFKFINNMLFARNLIKSIYLTCAEEVIEIPGPFKLNCLKIVEMDYQNRACVLAIDLFKDRP